MSAPAFKPEGIPPELQSLHQFVLWRLVPDRERPGKVKKLPFQLDGDEAKANDPSTWTDLDTAVARWQLGGYDGVGFEFWREDPFTFVDLDWKDREGATEAVPADVQAIVDRFPGAAVERSVSRKGLHLIVRGKVRFPDGTEGGKKGGVEIYAGRHFCALTGDILPGRGAVGAADESAALEALARERLPHKFAAAAAPTLTTATTEDARHEAGAALAARIDASKDARRFHGMFRGGDAGRLSGSEADFELAAILARHTADDDLVAWMMRESALATPERAAKWARADYLQRTIGAARRRAGSAGHGAQAAPLRLLTLEELDNPSLLRVPGAVGPWLTWRGELTYFPGREKLGKSTCAASDARGVARAGRFMWVTAEESRGRVVKRLRDLGIPLAAMLVPDRWPRSWEEVETLVADTRPDAVYVDSLASFLAAVGERIPETSEGEAWHGLMIRFKRWTTLGREDYEPAAGVCVFEHATKEDGSFRGSTGKAAAADTIVTMRSVAGDEQARRLETVGRWGFPSRTVRFAGDALGYEEVTMGRPAETEESAAKVIAAYRPGIKSREWIDATGLADTTFYRAREAAMAKQDDGTWRVRPRFSF